jgi:hypothetical protein
MKTRLIYNFAIKFRRITKKMSEETKAADPAIPGPDEDSLFDKIVKRQIPSTVVYEDDLCMAFRDITP